MAIGDVTAVLLFAAPLFAGALEYEIQLSSSPEPFAIKVSECFLQFTEEKLKLTRLPVDVDQPDWTDGPPVHNATSVRDYWIDEYKWIDVQADLNTRFHQYTVNISPGPDCTYCEDVPLHFVHHRSNRSDAIPLLFLHGWPGSFIEVGNIIAGLTSPADLSVPAFHIVAPSLPGYAFSPAPTKTGFGARAAAEAFNALMVAKLGYAKYVVQGGDIGAFVLRFLAGNHPESVVSALSNLWITPPTPGDKTRYYSNKSSPDEAFTIESYGKFENFSSGYRLEMQTQPLQLGYGLTDSPIGLAMWIYNFMHTGVDKYVWTAKDIITWTMMYWIPGPYSGERMYKELVKDGVLENGIDINATFPYVTQPVAISEFPNDFWYRTPLDWARRGGNVVLRTVHDKGSHFASFETPDILIEDIRSFFGNQSLSNTGVFAIS